MTIGSMKGCAAGGPGRKAAKLSAAARAKELGDGNGTAMDGAGGVQRIMHGEPGREPSGREPGGRERMPQQWRDTGIHERVADRGRLAAESSGHRHTANKG